MTEPTREQVLEWMQRALYEANQSHGNAPLEDWEKARDENLCALAYAAGAKEENKAMRQLLTRQYLADRALYEMALDCTQKQHETALKEHDAVHAELEKIVAIGSAK